MVGPDMPAPRIFSALPRLGANPVFLISDSEEAGNEEWAEKHRPSDKKKTRRSGGRTRRANGGELPAVMPLTAFVSLIDPSGRFFRKKEAEGREDCFAGHSGSQGFSLRFCASARAGFLKS